MRGQAAKESDDLKVLMGLYECFPLKRETETVEESTEHFLVLQKILQLYTPGPWEVANDKRGPMFLIYGRALLTNYHKDASGRLISFARGVVVRYQRRDRGCGDCT